jgi:hypothetical protein
MRPAPLVLVLCLGCASPATRPAPPADEVHWLALTRDEQTAAAYTGRAVRLHLSRGEYACEGRELRVWANARDVPPVLVVRLREPLPAALSGAALVVTGTCAGPTRDGIRRTARGCDYFVTVEDATATGQ